MHSESPSGRDLLDTQTRPSGRAPAAEASAPVPALTILAHPQASRVGERALLPELLAGKEVALSRTSPMFGPPRARDGRPLVDPFLSRSPLAAITVSSGRFEIHRRRAGDVVRADGADVGDSLAVTLDDASGGAVLELGGRCALLFHLVDPRPAEALPRFGLVGDSDAVERLRREIARVASTELRVLVRGESGTGKELAARAIHMASSRAAGPYVAVNMGSIPTTLAGSALFGHARGAFSGADSEHVGHFEAAHGGTLFLDEVGDTDPAVQAMLLRVLETCEVQRIGDRRARKIDVRVISATDHDLESAVAGGGFREQLLHRFGELTLTLPPLRERRDDIGRLAVHFMREVLSAEEQDRLLDGLLAERPWLSAPTLATLARAPWTGNVRQLRNVVRQLAVLCRGDGALALPPELARSLASIDVRRSEGGGDPGSPPEDRASQPPESAKKRSKKRQDITEEEILDALSRAGWRRDAAADLLGISRSWLYALLASHPHLGRPSDLTKDRITEAMTRHDGDLEKMATELRVSAHGLKLRMQALGMAKG